MSKEEEILAILKPLIEVEWRELEDDHDQPIDYCTIRLKCNRIHFNDYCKLDEWLNK